MEASVPALPFFNSDCLDADRNRESEGNVADDNKHTILIECIDLISKIFVIKYCISGITLVK